MSYPGKLNLTCYQGETFTRTFTWSIAGIPVNLTGYSATVTIRSAPTATAIATLVSPTNITLGGSAGTIALTISSTTTAAFTAGSYLWDLILTSAGSVVTPVLAGQFHVTGAITHG